MLYSSKLPTSDAEKAAILAKILIKPSQQVKIERFVLNNAAGCNGICSSGTCR